MRAPWWCCRGWHPASLLCLLDIATRCKVRPICDAHDTYMVQERAKTWRGADYYKRTAARKSTPAEINALERRMQERRAKRDRSAGEQ